MGVDIYKTLSSGLGRFLAVQIGDEEIIDRLMEATLSLRLTFIGDQSSLSLIIGSSRRGMGEAIGGHCVFHYWAWDSCRIPRWGPSPIVSVCFLFFFVIIWQVFL